MTADPRHRRTAFTLVELLVVIGIIAVLMSILLPALGAVRRQARLVQCGSNLRNIGQACHLHAGQTGGYFPLVGKVVVRADTSPSDFPAGLRDGDRRKYVYVPVPGGSLTHTVTPFTAALAPYLGITDLPSADWNQLDVALNAKDGAWQRFICPDTDSQEKVLANSQADVGATIEGTMLVCAMGPRSVTAWATYSDYGANEGVFGFHYDGTYGRNRLAGRASAVRNAAEVVLFTDAVPRKTPADPIFARGWLTWTPSLDGAGPATLGDALADNGRATSPDNFDPVRHRNRLNVLFADGHVETLHIAKGDLDRAYLVGR